MTEENICKRYHGSFLKENSQSEWCFMETHKAEGKIRAVVRRETGEIVAYYDGVLTEPEKRM